MIRNERQFVATVLSLKWFLSNLDLFWEKSLICWSGYSFRIKSASHKENLT